LILPLARDGSLEFELPCALLGDRRSGDRRSTCGGGELYCNWYSGLLTAVCRPFTVGIPAVPPFPLDEALKSGMISWGTEPYP
jgi:hypothetical protein